MESNRRTFIKAAGAAGAAMFAASPRSAPGAPSAVASQQDESQTPYVTEIGRAHV